MKREQQCHDTSWAELGEQVMYGNEQFRETLVVLGLTDKHVKQDLSSTAGHQQRATLTTRYTRTHTHIGDSL